MAGAYWDTIKHLELDGLCRPYQPVESLSFCTSGHLALMMEHGEAGLRRMGMIGVIDAVQRELTKHEWVKVVDAKPNSMISVNPHSKEEPT